MVTEYPPSRTGSANAEVSVKKAFHFFRKILENRLLIAVTILISVAYS